MKKRPSPKRTIQKKTSGTSEKKFNEILKQVELERKKAEKEGYSITLSYPVQYRKGVEATIITSADGYSHYFYPEDGYWDYDGGEIAFEKGKIKRSKGIVGSVKIFLPVQSIKIGRGGNGLTIVDAKGETYQFS